MSTQSYWIKERYNPQLGTYFEAMGQLSKTKANRYLKPLYGENYMHEFKDETSYLARIEELKDGGHRFQ